MPINPNIHRTMADIVRVRMGDVIEYADYALQIVSQTESEVVHVVDEKAGTIKHQFEHLIEADPQIEPAVETVQAIDTNVVDMASFARRKAAEASQPLNFEQLLIDAQREAA